MMAKAGHCSPGVSSQDVMVEWPDRPYEGDVGWHDSPSPGPDGRRLGPLPRIYRFGRNSKGLLARRLGSTINNQEENKSASGSKQQQLQPSDLGGSPPLTNLSERSALFPACRGLSTIATQPPANAQPLIVDGNVEVPPSPHTVEKRILIENLQKYVDEMAPPTVASPTLTSTTKPLSSWDDDALFERPSFLAEAERIMEQLEAGSGEKPDTPDRSSDTSFSLMPSDNPLLTSTPVSTTHANRGNKRAAGLRVTAEAGSRCPGVSPEVLSTVKRAKPTADSWDDSSFFSNPDVLKHIDEVVATMQ